MTETRALVKSEAVRTLSPAETLTRVNRVLYNDIKRGMFVTVYYAILQLQKAILTCVSAGHNPMVLWRKASNTCHLVNPNGLALGIDKGRSSRRRSRSRRSSSSRATASRSTPTASSSR
jgi:sigma-B regulation protein RsbU (phosphoserine phosphatase)